MVYYEVFQNSEEATLRENQLSELPQKLLHEWVLENNPEMLDINDSGPYYTKKE
jgi:predicted GIY-YIG superfamily endonuclease